MLSLKLENVLAGKSLNERAKAALIPSSLTPFALSRVSKVVGLSTHMSLGCDRKYNSTI